MLPSTLANCDPTVTGSTLVFFAAILRKVAAEDPTLAALADPFALMRELETAGAA
ncbi:hypothetical protein [Prosthecomicrobium sp. N25]|uniref:hypothetical protein n=1 Tax=Prosthecomicrobium sp. N25 TaxID=3129254 RepID=UPI003078425E